MQHSKSNVIKKKDSGLLQICRWLKSSENFRYFRKQPGVLKRLWALKSDEVGFSGPKL